MDKFNLLTINKLFHFWSDHVWLDAKTITWGTILRLNEDVNHLVEYNEVTNIKLLSFLP